MKIAFLFPMDASFMAWNMGRGIVRAMERMGIQVLSIPLPTNAQASQQQFDAARKALPTIERIRECDAVLTSGPEHVGPWIEAIYERYEWRNLNIPTAAWLHESTERDDYQIDFEAIQWIARDWFFPAIQDAEKHDQEMFAKDHSHWLPFGVDTEMFCHPSRLGRYGGSEFDVAFIGLIYPKRLAFLQAISRHEIPPIRLGKVEIQDLHGYDHEGSTRRYVENLRAIKVFFNLPALSRLIVNKVTEVMACGGFLLTPMLSPDGGANRNMALFESGTHLVYYRPSNTPYIAQLLREWISKEMDAERDKIAEAGFRLVQEKHTLEKRVAEILTKMGLNVAQTVN